jgi:hypothetical protein
MKANPGIIPRFSEICLVIGHDIGAYKETLPLAQVVFLASHTVYTGPFMNIMNQKMVSYCGTVIMAGLAFLCTALIHIQIGMV